MLSDERIDGIKKLRAGNANDFHIASEIIVDDLLAERRELVARIAQLESALSAVEIAVFTQAGAMRIVDSVTTYGAYEKPI